jgi:homoserine dehydrogenase
VVRIAVLGCGTVGSALVGILQERADELAVQSGARLEIGGIAVNDPTRVRGAHIPTELITDRAADLVVDPSIDVVVELIGGEDPTGELVRAALEAGKPVVTANKALLASAEGVGLRTLAKKQGVDLLYEAAVAGAIPLVRALRESLTGERIQRVMGIVNGTTNFILTRMSEQGADYADALAEAQSLGFAERDPTADVEGHDAAAKAAILAGVAFGYDVAGSEVMCEGITAIRPVDIEFAERFGYTVKLLAVVERTDDDALSVRVHPALVPRSHPLAGVRDAFNAVFIEGEAAGELMLYGQGAGGLPTASAVVGDLIDATRNLLAGTTAPSPERTPARLLPESELQTQYYLSLHVTDRPGVLAAVTKVLGDNHVSIRSMEQDGRAGEARLTFVTHRVREGDVRATLATLGELDAVLRVGGLMRMVGDAER